MGGVEIELRCSVVMRGISNPLVVDEISSIALASGSAPVLFMPMFCAFPIFSTSTARNRKPKYVFILITILSDVEP